MELTLLDHTDGQLTDDQRQLATKLLNYAADYLHVDASAEMSLTFVLNDEIRQLNKEYRGVDRATDVISFAAEENGDESAFEIPAELRAELPENLGDLFICLDKVPEQALFLGHSAERELGFLVVHGFLHLNGYDHEEPADEKKMFALQREILDSYGLTR